MRKISLTREQKKRLRKHLNLYLFYHFELEEGDGELSPQIMAIIRQLCPNAIEPFDWLEITPSEFQALSNKGYPLTVILEHAQHAPSAETARKWIKAHGLREEAVRRPVERRRK